jgi:hypothetical protein
MAVASVPTLEIDPVGVIAHRPPQHAADAMESVLVRENTPIRVCWLVAFLLLLVPLGLRSIILAVTPVDHLRDIVDFIYDDGYYYLAVAANLAETGHSTFDGISATNGYQPLWLLLLTVPAKLAGAHPFTLFRLSCGLIYVIALGAPLLAALWRRGITRELMFCFGAGLAIAMVEQPTVFLRGLEPILFAPVLMVLVALIERARSDPQTLRHLSIVLAVAFLIRLDALAVYAAVLAGLPLLTIWRQNLNLTTALTIASKVALRISAFVIPTVLVYMAVNQWLFGSPVPVSGLAKFVGGARFTNWGATQIFFENGKPMLPFLAILVALELLTRRAGLRPPPFFYRSLAVISLGIALQAFYYGAFSTWYVWPWYTYLVAADLALVLARIIYLCSLLYRSTSHSIMSPRLAATAALLFVGVWASEQSRALTRSSLSPQMMATLHHKTQPAAQENAPAGELSYNQVSLEMLQNFFTAGRNTVIAMGDRAGGLGFWGRDRLSVVQTEGILLDMGYIRARAANEGAEYLEHFPIEYLVTDREVIPTVTTAEGRVLYVVADPIQGRVNFGPVPTFCFPADAARYQKAYPSPIHGINERSVFQFSARVPCTDTAMSLMRSIEKGIGLRQYSLPTEYDPAKGDLAGKSTEDRDRRRALNRPVGTTTRGSTDSNQPPS